MNLKHILTSAVLLGVVLLAGTAQAAARFTPQAVDQTATLFTPPLVPEGKNELDCYLVNVSGKTLKATIQVFNRDGAVVRSVPTTLQPGHEDVATASASEAPRYCKFVVEGRQSDVRGSILVRQKGVGAISALPAE